MVSSFEYFRFHSSMMNELLGKSSNGFLTLGSAGTMGSSSSSSAAGFLAAFSFLGAAAASALGLSALPSFLGAWY